MIDLSPGQNAPLPDGGIVVRFGARPDAAPAAPLRTFAFALDAQGRCDGPGSVCCDASPEALGGALRLDAGAGGFRIAPAAFPARIERIAVCLAVSGGRIAVGELGLDALSVAVEAGGAPAARIEIPARERLESALILVEIYRRNGAWKIRAVAQGHLGGLSRLADVYGIRLDDTDHRHTEPPPEPNRATGQPPATDDHRHGKQWSGTAFVVSREGLLITNAHVIEGATRLQLRSSTRRVAAETVFVDAVNDLALVRAESALPVAAVFRDGPTIRTGESVVAIGYPLAGLLGTDPSATGGNISALTAVAGDSRALRFTAPVQGGNSGGPLLDASGLVVGVVTSKLAAGSIYEATGDLPQNVNFAMKSALARLFLEAAGVSVDTRPPSAAMAPADIVAESARYVFRIEASG